MVVFILNIINHQQSIMNRLTSTYILWLLVGDNKHYILMLIYYWLSIIKLTSIITTYNHLSPINTTPLVAGLVTARPAGVWPMPVWPVAKPCVWRRRMAPFRRGVGGFSPLGLYNISHISHIWIYITYMDIYIYIYIGYRSIVW